MQRTTALYYPAAVWSTGTWLKTALLFFDQVVLLRRDAAHGKETVLDLDLLDLLEECGAVRVSEPATELDPVQAGYLRETLLDDAVWNALDDIGAERRFYYGARVFSTLNGPEPSLEMMELRNVLMERLGSGDFVAQAEGNHAYPTYRVGGQTPSVPVHIRLWAPLMSVLPQYLRSGPLAGDSYVIPLSNHPSGAAALGRLLSLPGLPSAGRVRIAEPLPVAPDLADLPWPEVLQLRPAVREAAARVVTAMLALVAEPAPERHHELDAAAETVRQTVTGLVGRRPLFHLGALGSSWRAQDIPDYKLATLARLLGSTEAGPDSRAISWTLAFQRGTSIADAADITR